MPTSGTVLVADDDAATIDLLTEVLTDEGYQVRRATTGKAALAAILTAPPDLALIDLRLGTMSGLEVIQVARAWSFAMPMVLMTAAPVEADALEAQGASATLRKPFDLDDLLICVARHMPQPGRSALCLPQSS